MPLASQSGFVGTVKMHVCKVAGRVYLVSSFSSQLRPFSVACRFSERERPFCWQRNNVSLFARELFPCWKLFVSPLGTVCSHTWNLLFPPWEYFVCHRSLSFSPSPHRGLHRHTPTFRLKNCP